MTGTKIEACHQIMADFDDLAVCWKLVLNFEQYEHLGNTGVLVSFLFKKIYKK